MNYKGFDRQIAGNAALVLRDDSRRDHSEARRCRKGAKLLGKLHKRMLLLAL
jgi:hypothetical protein